MGSKALAKGAAYPVLVVESLAQVERDLGGRAQVAGMLALAPLTADLRYILGLLGDPRQQGKSLAEVCALGNILPGELLRHLTTAAMVVGKVKVAKTVGDGMAAVAQDVMRRAAPFEEACGACRGTGSITPEPTKAETNPGPGPCETCAGVGRLRYLPDLARQELALELAHLLPKGGGLQILNQNIAQASGGHVGGDGLSVLDRLTDLSDQVLYGQAKRGAAGDDVVEGETIDTDGEPDVE